MKFTVEVLRKDNKKKSCTTQTDGTEASFKKCVNSYDLFYKVGQFKAYRLIDENGNVVFKKGNI